jgi:hypothetical protein
LKKRKKVSACLQRKATVIFREAPKMLSGSGDVPKERDSTDQDRHPNGPGQGPPVASRTRIFILGHEQRQHVLLVVLHMHVQIKPRDAAA